MALSRFYEVWYLDTTNCVVNFPTKRTTVLLPRVYKVWYYDSNQVCYHFATCRKHSIFKLNGAGLATRCATKLATILLPLRYIPHSYSRADKVDVLPWCYKRRCALGDFLNLSRFL